MPHISVKLYSGRSEQQKARLAQEICKALTEVLRCEEKSVSVAIEDINPEDWTEKVFKAEIVGHIDKLYKKPGYGSLNWR
jgi:4-oxalocrotonate tautomerase